MYLVYYSFDIIWLFVWVWYKVFRVVLIFGILIVINVDVCIFKVFEIQ